jgi:alkylation response protein AidB-like acyl-CoA dehydrogenase
MFADNTALDEWVAPDCHGENFFDIDKSLQDVITVYLPDDLRRHLTPHFRRLGEIAGNELDDWSRLADRHGPMLHDRGPRGEFEDRLEFHPAYRFMEDVGFHQFGLHRMVHKPGMFGWDAPIPHGAKFVFQYLFGQSEFALLCPISATETTATMIDLHGDDALKARFFERLVSLDKDEILKGAQFMTERTGGSDVSNIALEARFEEGEWRLYGEKWFCSCADGDVAMLLARVEGAPEGNAGLALFAMPRTLDDRTRNRYRIIRLKDKLGSRSMASGEIVFDGALAYALGDVGAKKNQGLKMMMDQVALSRLSHGARAASMMRRCLNEAMVVARNRSAFQETIINKPLLRRQLMKLLLPTEQALSMTMYLGQQITLAQQGDVRAERITRILTPAHKYRSARDNVRVATGSMEVRGGNGYIEDFVNARLVRDAHLGVLWEGTSNINSLDITTRAVAKVGAHKDLEEALRDKLDTSDAMPRQFRSEVGNTVAMAMELADEIGASGKQTLARKAATAIYNAASATLLAAEGAALGADGGDARRLIMARMVLDRMRAQDPLSVRSGAFEQASTDLLLDDAPVSLDKAAEVVAL